MDYEDPRPTSQDVGSTEGTVLKDNLITLDAVMNAESGTEITNRKGEELKPIVDIVGEATNAIQQAVDDLAGDTVQNTNDISALTEALGETDEAVQENASAIQQNATGIDELETSTASSISELQSQADGNSSDIESLQELTGTHTSAIDTLESDNNQNKIDIAQNTSDIAAIVVESSKIAPNMIKESQCVVPNPDVGVPVNGVTETYTTSGNISHSWKRITTDTMNVTKDALGNVFVTNWSTVTNPRIAIDVPVDVDAVVGDFVGKAYRKNSAGVVEEITEASVSLFIFNAGTVRIEMPMGNTPDGKVFAFSLSQEEGDIEILAEQTIIDNVLGANTEGFEILEYGNYGNNSSGTIPQGYEWEDFSRIEIYSGTNIASTTAGPPTVMIKGQISLNPTSWTAQIVASTGAYVKVGASSSTGWAIGNNASNDGGVVKEIRGWF